MISDLDALLEAGAAGVAVGPLTAEKTVDKKNMSRFVKAAGNRSVVFHRAFDVCADPFTTLEKLIDLGVTRILTSGQARTAVKGIGILIELMERARGRIEILPGAGVNPSNAAELADRTGCGQLHGSFRGPDGTFDPSLLDDTRGALDRLSQPES
jgi:copper homeostasis protein